MNVFTYPAYSEKNENMNILAFDICYDAILGFWLEFGRILIYLKLHY